MVKMKYQILNKNFILVFLSVSLSIECVFSQATGDPKEDFLYGEFYIEQHDYKRALPFYLSALSANTTNCNINFRVGECFLNILGQQSQALPYLENAVKSITESYIPGRYTNQQAPPIAWMYLGDAYHRENMLQEASYAYFKFKSYLNERDKELLAEINRRIVGLGISFEYQRNIEFINMANMGPVINTRFSDYNPVLSGDQRTLLYTSFWESYDRVLMSTLTPDGWTTPIEINDQLQSRGDCYTTALSYQGDFLVLVRKENEFNSDLYYSTFTEGRCQPIQAFGKNINSSWLESSACLSRDASELYFSSDRPGGEGGFDIYVSILKDGEWGKPKNLGKAINTPYDEEAPYISSDDKTLHFSSNGHESVGGMDFLVSRKTEDGDWGHPENMGLPYNTTEDDVFIIYFDETETGYFSRETLSGLGKQDIIIVQNGDFTQNWLDQTAPVVNQQVIDSLEKSKTAVFGVENTYYQNVHTKKAGTNESVDTIKKNDSSNPNTVKPGTEENGSAEIGSTKSSPSNTNNEQLRTNNAVPSTPIGEGALSAVASTGESGTVAVGVAAASAVTTAAAGGIVSTTNIGSGSNSGSEHQSASSSDQQSSLVSDYQESTMTSTPSMSSGVSDERVIAETSNEQPHSVNSVTDDSKHPSQSITQAADEDLGGPDKSLNINQNPSATSTIHVEEYSSSDKSSNVGNVPTGGNAILGQENTTSNQVSQPSAVADVAAADKGVLAPANASASTSTIDASSVSHDNPSAQASTSTNSLVSDNSQRDERQNHKADVPNTVTEDAVSSDDRNRSNAPNALAANSEMGSSGPMNGKPNGNNASTKVTTATSNEERSGQTEVSMDNAPNSKTKSNGEVKTRNLTQGKESLSFEENIEKELIDFYTVQIIALKKPREADYFKTLEGVIISKGTDGFYRYTVGHFDKKADARKAMNNIRSQGFPDAFIRKAFTINNYGNSNLN